MSENWIALIPEDPHFVPDLAKQHRARDRFAEIAPYSAEIKIDLFERVMFVCCGAYFKRICCPSCGSEISTVWWNERMNRDYDDGFKLDSYSTPCCGAECTLHNLVYEGLQGFGRFALEATNPNIGMLEDSHKQEIEEILGTKLRVIYTLI